MADGATDRRGAQRDNLARRLVHAHCLDPAVGTQGIHGLLDRQRTGTGKATGFLDDGRDRGRFVTGK